MTDFLSESLFTHPDHLSLINSEFGIPTFFKLLPAFLSITGGCLALLLFKFMPNLLIKFKLSKIGRKLYFFFNQKYYYDILINKFVVYKGFELANITSKVLDRGIIELMGPFGLVNKLVNYSFNLSKLDNGIITNYALYIVIGFIVLLYTLIISHDPRLLLIYIASIITLSGIRR